MDVQLLGHGGKALDDPGLHVVLVHGAGGNIEGHEVVDDDHGRFVFLYPVIDRVCHNLPVRAKVVIVNRELAGQHGIQFFLDAGLQAVVVLIQWILHHEVRAGSLKQHPFTYTGSCHFTGKHGHLEPLRNRRQPDLTDQR